MKKTKKLPESLIFFKYTKRALNICSYKNYIKYADFKENQDGSLSYCGKLHSEKYPDITIQFSLHFQNEDIRELFADRVLQRRSDGTFTLCFRFIIDRDIYIKKKCGDIPNVITKNILHFSPYHLEAKAIASKKLILKQMHYVDPSLPKSSARDSHTAIHFSNYNPHPLQGGTFSHK